MIAPPVRIVGLQSCELKVGADGIEIFVARFALSDGTIAATHWPLNDMLE